ncbi:MAG: FecR family protein [candidate division WOR-3 bacterium]
MIKLLMILSLVYSGHEFARVGDIQGDARIWRYGDEGYEWLTINNIVGEGDEIETLDNTYLEIEFSDGSVLSLAENTSIYFERIENDRAYITLTEGIIRLYSRERVFGVFTDKQAVYVNESSVVRVETGKSYFTLKVFKGRVEVNRSPVYAGTEYIYERGRVFTGRLGAPDRFDRWAEEREREYYSVVGIEYIPVPYYAGVPYLRRHGRWVYVPPYGWVWVPRVRHGWRPYVDGHWVYRVGIGWVWVSYEPWGWIPYRYGSWMYVSGYGWVWIPGGTFAGAWVEWYYGPDWIGWAPVDYYGRPIVVVNNITIVNVVRKEDFQKPVYRYKPPKGPVYKEAVYRTVEKVNTREIVKYKSSPEKPAYIRDIELKQEKPVLPESGRRERKIIPGEKRDVFEEKPAKWQGREVKSEDREFDRPEIYIKPQTGSNVLEREEDKSPRKPYIENQKPVMKEAVKIEDGEESKKPATDPRIHYREKIEKEGLPRSQTWKVEEKEYKEKGAVKESSRFKADSPVRKISNGNTKGEAKDVRMQRPQSGNKAKYRIDSKVENKVEKDDNIKHQEAEER